MPNHLSGSDSALPCDSGFRWLLYAAETPAKGAQVVSGAEPNAPLQLEALAL